MRIIHHLQWQHHRDYEADLLLEAELVQLLEAIEQPADQKEEP